MITKKQTHIKNLMIWRKNVRISQIQFHLKFRKEIAVHNEIEKGK